MILKAVEFATVAHKDQVRKYSGLPYIVHPVGVARILEQHEFGPDIIAAAILHDTIEDTDVTFNDIEREFGGYIADLVLMVTKVSMPANGNRATRKAIDMEHYAMASYSGKAIKLADITYNVSDVVKENPEFAAVYIPEQLALVKALTPRYSALGDVALAAVEKAAKDLAELEK